MNIFERILLFHTNPFQECIHTTQILPDFSYSYACVRNQKVHHEYFRNLGNPVFQYTVPNLQRVTCIHSEILHCCGKYNTINECIMNRGIFVVNLKFQIKRNINN